jgi:hypothetical protein
MGDTKQEEEEEAFSAAALAYVTLRNLRMGVIHECPKFDRGTSC